MEVKVGEEPLKAATNKSVLANVGKAMARVGAPLPVAAIDAYFIGQQVKEGKGTAEIASNPLNWLGLATMSPLTKAAGLADKSGKLSSVLRLGLNPATIRGISRFAGLPGLAISTAMTAYDQYEKYKDGDLITLKLASGEEVIANYKGATDTYISIEKALVLMNGPQGLAFGTFFSTADQEKEITIAKDKIQCVSIINSKIEEEYKRVFNKVVVPEKPKIIV